MMHPLDQNEPKSGRLDMLWAILVVFNFTVLVLGANYTRFTWWGWTSFFLYSLLNAVGGRNALHDRDLFFATVAGIIVIGVITMSMFNDSNSLLASVAADYGLLTYFAGTFTVHYFPVAVIFTNCSALHHLNVREAKQIGLGLSLFFLYLIYEDPRTIYGVDIGQALAAGAAFSCGLLAILVLWEIKPAHIFKV